jgi:hypothetical protein
MVILWRRAGIEPLPPQLQPDSPLFRKRPAIHIKRRGKVLYCQSEGLEERDFLWASPVSNITQQDIPQLRQDMGVVKHPFLLGNQEVASFVQGGFPAIDEQAGPDQCLRIELATEGKARADRIDMSAWFQPFSSEYGFPRRRHGADDVRAAYRFPSRIRWLHGEGKLI